MNIEKDVKNNGSSDEIGRNMEICQNIWMLVIDIGQARAKLNTPLRDVIFMEAEYLLSVICYHQMLYGIKGLVLY